MCECVSVRVRRGLVWCVVGVGVVWRGFVWCGVVCGVVCVCVCVCGWRHSVTDHTLIHATAVCNSGEWCNLETYSTVRQDQGNTEMSTIWE